MTTKALTEAIIKKNGEGHQTAVAMGELGELTNELSKALRGKPDNKHICEEIADVEICLAQMKRIFDPTGKNVALYKTFKYRRLALYYIDGEDK